MREFMDYVGRHWVSGLLIVGVGLSIWFVVSHRDKLMFNKQEPPAK